MSLLDGIPLRTLTKRKGPYSFSCMGFIRLRSGRQGTLSPWTPCDFFVKKSSKNFITPAGGTKAFLILSGTLLMASHTRPWLRFRNSFGVLPNALWKTVEK